MIDIDLDIASTRKTSMLIDTGSQISLINKKILKNESEINPQNKITISSIHGSEKTLGDINASIKQNNKTIPIQLQVTNNKFLNEDGILGYDIIGDSAIIDCPNKTITLNSKETNIKFPIRKHNNNSDINLITREIQSLQNIEYLNTKEISPQYEINLRRVQSITEEINPNAIKINSNKYLTSII